MRGEPVTKYAHVQGLVEPGFGKVAEAFERNFTEHGELGAGFALYAGGRQVVDIWGGVADRASGRAWDADTLQLVFSTTKGATAICVAKLVDDGRLSYDDKVAMHWPEFAAEGKEGITVGELLSHQAGLIAYDRPLTFDEVMAVTPVVEALAAQRPLWQPGTAHGYHALTYGWLAGEVVRRVDGRTLGRFFADEIAGPLGLEFWIGLPEQEEPRVTTLELAPPPTDPAEIELLRRMYARGANAYRALSLDGVIRMMPENHFNTRALHASEMPGANGITTARSLARMYAACVGEVDGVRLLSAETVAAARAERVQADDLTLLRNTRFGAGFWLHEGRTSMIQEGSFGHPGAGGSLGYANPELGIGYGYVMNQMAGGLTGDPRTITLNEAVLASL
ncbi:MAG TPA: serine hydrolase domain-containing protein [Ilumatobacter sp.]|nr:serine hydrolase domain-containing protein [Ilumatobacter sp.]